MKDISKNNFIKIKEKIFNNQNTDIIDIILNSTVNGILITDIDGNIKWVNKAFEKNTGYSLQEVIGKNPRILKSGLTKREEYEYMWESILNKGYFEGQIYNINKYGFIYKQSVKIWRIKEYFLAIIDYEKSYEKTEKEIKSQFYLASKIQQKLLPPIPELDNLNITYTYKSLNEVGGDIIEIIKIDKNKTLVFVGDVSGHGIPAAMIQMMLKTLIKEEKNYEDIENYIKIINKKMIELDIEMYLTCFYGIFDTDKMLLEYVLCGHPYPILINDNYVKFIQNQNSQIIGIFEDPKIITRKIKLEKNQKFIIYTDGLSEATNLKNEEFGEYILGILQDKNIIKNYNINNIIRLIENFLNIHTLGKTQEDDYSIVGIEIL